MQHQRITQPQVVLLWTKGEDPKPITWTLEPPAGPSMVREVMGAGQPGPNGPVWHERAVAAALGLCLPSAIRTRLKIGAPETFHNIFAFGVAVWDALMLAGAKPKDVHEAGVKALGYGYACWQTVLTAKGVKERVGFSSAPEEATT